MTNFLRYWRTVRYLKPIQIYGRLWFRIYRPQPDLRPAPELRYRSGFFLLPARREPSLQKSGLFNFIGETAALDDVGWDNPNMEKLWRYNQHYFDDLNAAGSAIRLGWHLDLLTRWIEGNPPGVGTGWEPYPTSLRIVNWIKWSLAGNTLSTECICSLAIQIRLLRRRLEVHLLGNHLFANAKALVFAGLFFKGPEADNWLEKGFNLLNQEIPEQILSDGGQFERSTMYHALALEDMLDMCNVARAFPDAIPEHWSALVSSFPDVIGKMRDWLAGMIHPDREISFFNDAAIGISPSPTELEAYALRLGFPQLPDKFEGVTHLAESGYIRIQRGPLVALLDVARVGPDYLPGHAHADTLSFEISLFEHRIFVNSGISCYGISAERNRQRSTSAHCTVVVDGQDSSEVWGGFRVARRAKPADLKIEQQGENVTITCAHDGYSRLSGKPVHRRQWTFRGTDLEIEDTVSGKFGKAEARFYLHPLVETEEIFMNSAGVQSVFLRMPKGQKILFSVEGGRLQSEAATWHPVFGGRVPNICLIAGLNSPVLRTRLSWAGVD